MTAITDLRGSDLRLRLRLYARQFRTWALKRGRPVLPLYEAERPTWWAVLRRMLLLAAVCAITFFYGLLVSVLPPFLLVPAAAPPAILTLVVIWALPDAPRAPVRMLARLFMIFSMIMLLWPNYLSFTFGGLPWISLRRLIGSVAVLLLLVCVSTSKKFRTDMAAILGSSPWITRLMLGFIAVEAISTFTSSALGETINRFVDMQIMWTAMFFISAWYFGTAERNSNRWVNSILWCSGILMVVGAIEFKVEHVLWADYIPSFLQIQDEAVQQMLRPNFRDRYRVVTTFSSPLSYGEFLALIAPLILHKLMNSKTALRISLWAVADLILLISAFLSGARLSMVGYIVAHAVYFLLWGIRRWRTQPGGLIGPSLTLMYPALMVSLSMLIVSVDALRTRVLGGGASQQSNDARSQQFDLAVPAVAHRPLFGFGPGEGAGAVGWRTMDGKLSIDSGFLSIAADYGLIGFACFYGAIVFAIAHLMRSGIFARGTDYSLRLALAAMLVVLLTARSVLSQQDNNPLVFMMVGLSLALIYRASQEPQALVTDATKTPGERNG
ncbi:O-antigen ligase family protein [Sphingomonas sp. JC676]|uniref:O-antigen ligase family protein n=1 Tax=Sphingomonas sp. JC676 TaxID=2768065 RepID=UPI0016584F40|nr:O-antigen ligase family protein [Sphingomonas sp. JC676]MBC9032795.1 O-antigen ligase family protein [Sphingomonas sp. JC676]